MGLSQVEFAKALGVSSTTITHWETGRAQPSQLSMYNLYKLADKEEGTNGDSADPTA